MPSGCTSVLRVDVPPQTDLKPVSPGNPSGTPTGSLRCMSPPPMQRIRERTGMHTLSASVFLNPDQFAGFPTTPY